MASSSTTQPTPTYNIWNPPDPDWLSDQPVAEEKEPSLLANILRLYQAAMTGDVRSPVPHLVGPPGCGKSTSVEQAAALLGVNLHIINVSRISPLELEGVQMPVEENSRLHMLTATWWTQLREGDIVLLDEFLRGFPEVYNGLLDILTSRQVGGFQLPRVFFIGASNSTTSYDKALEDRLLHLPVADPRTNQGERKHIAKMLVEATGMVPEMVHSASMEEVIDTEILPMYKLLDQFKGKANIGAASIQGHSVRNLIGQVRLRQIESGTLKNLVTINNQHAMKMGHVQYVILPDGRNPDPQYVSRAQKLRGDDRLTEIQAQNLELNLQLIEMEIALSEQDEGGSA